MAKMMKLFRDPLKQEQPDSSILIELTLKTSGMKSRMKKIKNYNTTADFCVGNQLFEE